MTTTQASLAPRALLLARSHIAMVTGLLGGLALVLWLEGTIGSPSSAATDPMAPFAGIAPLPLAKQHTPNAEESRAAAIAWRYFKNNINPDTGLVASVDGYPSTTMWETGALIDAVVSADRLGLIKSTEAEALLAQTVGTLAKLPLTPSGLPNKAYDIRSLAMVTYKNEPTQTGTGWSAIDMGRLLASLYVAERAYPSLSEPIGRLLSGWSLSRLVTNGELTGGNIVDGAVVEHQEGRIGYEQYAAKAMMAHLLDANAALNLSDDLTGHEVSGVIVPGDNRLNRNRVPAFTTSEPYLLDGLQFGFDARSHLFASQVFRAQEQRFVQTGIPTAVSEGHITVAPFFAYSTVWGGGHSWAVLTSDGKRMDSRRVLSTKAAFAWDALFDTSYSNALVAKVAHLVKPERGWMEGQYERDGTPDTAITANTNAMVLSSIAYRKNGPLIGVVK